MTGSFPKTSARYILIIPELTFSQVFTCTNNQGGAFTEGYTRTADMSSSIGECHLSEAVFIYARCLRSKPSKQDKKCVQS